MTSPAIFRKRFPIFSKKIFLNSCSKGALSRDVEDAYRNYISTWGEGGSPWEEWMALLESTRERLAGFLGCGPDELAISFCASTAVSALASALSFEGKRNAVVLGDFEFPTMAHIWLAQEKRGAQIKRARAGNDELPVGSYEDVIDETARIVPVGHVCFRNGYRQDVRSVVRLASEAGAYSLVDDYQSSGTRPLDVKELDCDFLVSGCLKYLLGSSGLAFLYVREELIQELEPTLTGWFAQERPFDFDIERATYHASARRFETGTPPNPCLYAGMAGLELVEQVGTKGIAAHVESLATELLEGAKKRGWSAMTPEEPERRGPLVVLHCRDARRAVDLLEREGIVVSDRGAGLRVSFHYYNLSEDVEALFSVLDEHEELMERGD